ncbi:MATE family efflux transporter [Candidatus Haliotispira prima]|uniref:Multidrug-efflux transporter n=1 Tax=Candidatus Haliotispira prima TaxID=3034016 RepID=A0ABY8MHJ0_9SPIO|nr:MATE family efflux transporter [Candidatus Haliotispira prima]
MPDYKNLFDSTTKPKIGADQANRLVVLDSYKKIFRLAYPVVLVNAVDTVMMMVDRLFLSRFGEGAEGGILLGGSMGGAVITLLAQAPVMGLLLYTNAIASQNFGRKDLPRCAQVVTQAMYWAILYYPLMLFFSRFVPAALEWMKHDPALAGAEWQYSRVLIGGAVFALLRLPLNSFFIASNRSGLVMKVSFIGMALNIPLDYWFIFDVPLLPGLFEGFGLGARGLRPGDLGLPTGIAGAAAATVVAQFLTFSLLMLLFLRQKREYRIREAWRFRPNIHREMLRFGLPASLEGFLTVFSFNAFLMLLYSISPLVAAAGTITFSWDLCNFTLLMGIGTATTTLVGRSLGAGDVAMARHFTKLILGAALAFSGFISLWFIFAPDLLSRAFIPEGTANQEALLDMSRTMLRLATFYLLADALGMVMRGALTGAGDTFAVMLIAVSMHFLLLAGTLIMLKVLGLGAIPIWTFFVVFVLVCNGAFVLRYATGHWAKHWARESPKYARD